MKKYKNQNLKSERNRITTIEEFYFVEPEWASISAFELIKNQFDLLESVVDEAISKFGPIPYRSTVSLDELE